MSIPTVRTDALTKRCAEVLMRHGRYEEGPDDLEWLRYEASDMADMLDLGLGVDSLVAGLADTAWWDPSDESPDRAYACAADLVALVHDTPEAHDG